MNATEQLWVDDRLQTIQGQSTIRFDEQAVKARSDLACEQCST